MFMKNETKNPLAKLPPEWPRVMMRLDLTNKKTNTKTMTMKKKKYIKRTPSKSVSTDVWPQFLQCFPGVGPNFLWHLRSIFSFVRSSSLSVYLGLQQIQQRSGHFFRFAALLPSYIHQRKCSKDPSWGRKRHGYQIYHSLNFKSELHKYRNTRIQEYKVLKGPNMCYMFEMSGLQGYQIWNSVCHESHVGH